MDVILLLSGGPSRCYQIFNNYRSCMNERVDPIVCWAFREDYFECLHHKKEFARNKRIEEAKKEYIKKHGKGSLNFEDDL